MAKKILIIDKNIDILKKIKEQFENKGYKVSTAYNGKDGLAYAKQFKPDLIILSIMNPEVNEFETLRKLKEDDDTADIPVILESFIESHEQDGLKLGAVNFLCKPIDFNSLYTTVENVVSKKKLTHDKAVLVIDDDESIVEMTRDFLESKNIRTYGALSGPEGISILHKEKIGLILLDLKMPGMDGYEVVQKIKAEPELEDIPIIIITSVDIKECREKCLMLGAQECFTKPLKSDILLGKVKNFIDNQEIFDKSSETMKAKVLVADDEEALRELISDTLEAEGYDLVLAENGREAIEKVYSEHPDIVVLDVKMPFMTGYEVCEKIRDDILLSNLPIIMLTVKSSEKDEIRGLELGVDDYLTKPFKPAILVARIKAALSRTIQGINVNPLTYLPGNTSIVREIERRVKNEEEFAVLYVDIDRFKAFNDYYGFHKGDEIIKLTARILVDVIKKKNPDTGFIGHIGGDDFIGMIDIDNIHSVCDEIIIEFDNKMLEHYNDEDKKNGFIEIENRKGVKERFALAALSIGVVPCKKNKITHIGEISKFGAELKKFAKKEENSNYVLDRRMEQ